jgi:hypothetical protein
VMGSLLFVKLDYLFASVGCVHRNLPWLKMPRPLSIARAAHSPQLPSRIPPSVACRWAFSLPFLVLVPRFTDAAFSASSGRALPSLQ